MKCPRMKEFYIPPEKLKERISMDVMDEVIKNLAHHEYNERELKILQSVILKMQEGKDNMEYHGITYPEKWNKEKKLKQWRRKRCWKGHHLFDEVVSIGKHYLYCDACGLIVYIAGIEEGE